MSNNNRDMALRSTIVIVLFVIVLVLFYNIFSGGLYYAGRGSFNDIVATTLVLAVKILWIIFIVSLAVGFVLALKKYLLQDKRNGSKTAAGMNGSGYCCPCCGAGLTAEFKFCPNCKASLKDICAKCGKELQLGWNSCPWCGQHRNNA